MTTGVLLALALALVPRAADAHGYMTKPSSRSELAYDDYVARLCGIKFRAPRHRRDVLP